jgi:hypothetical protein
MTEESYSNTISGLLRRRDELMGENASLRERMAVIANDIEAIDRVLDGLGYAGELEGRAVRQERIILFYRNEMKEFLIKQLREAEHPLSTRDIAEILCRTENRDARDRRMLNDIVKRLSKGLRVLKSLGMVESTADATGTFIWTLTPKGLGPWRRT